jgi:integrase
MELRSLDDLLVLYIKERMPSVDMVRQLEVVIRSLRSFTRSSLLDELTREALFGWRDHLLKERQVKVATWNNYLRHLKVLINFAKESGVFDFNISGVRSLPDYRRAKRVLSEPNIKTVIKWLRHADQVAMPGWFWESVCKMLYYSGMRRRQLVGLCWRDIDRREGVIRLGADSSKTKLAWNIPMTQALSDVLTDVHRMTRAINKPCNPNDQVFNITLFNERYKSQHMTVDHVSAAFRRIGDKTGVEISAHRFRHTFASQLAKQGRIKELQQVLGHADVRTTLGYVEPDMKSMSELMSGLSMI